MVLIRGKPRQIVGSSHCFISFSNSLRSAVVFRQHLFIGRWAFRPRRACPCSFAGVCCSMVMVGFPLRARHGLAKCSEPVLLAVMLIEDLSNPIGIDTKSIYWPYSGTISPRLGSIAGVMFDKN